MCPWSHILQRGPVDPFFVPDIFVPYWEPFDSRGSWMKSTHYGKILIFFEKLSFFSLVFAQVCTILNIILTDLREVVQRQFVWNIFRWLVLVGLFLRCWLSTIMEAIALKLISFLMIGWAFCGNLSNPTDILSFAQMFSSILAISRLEYQDLVILGLIRVSNSWTKQPLLKKYAQGCRKKTPVPLLSISQSLGICSGLYHIKYYLNWP